jgi:Fe-Mn family superoxide dismutase
VEAWQDAFAATAKSARGWAILAYEQRTQTCRNILLDSHDEGVICSAYPLLVLDMYEHAYFLDFTTDKATYIDGFLAQIPWSVVERRVSLVIR